MALPRGRAVAVVVLGLVLGLGACDRLLSAERRIERAEEAFAAGRYDSAMNDVKAALESEPANVAGRLLLARIALRIGDSATARKELDRALEAGADPALARELHYDIFLQQGRFQDALIGAAADDALEPVRRLVIMGNAQAALGQFEDAEKSAQEALALQRDDRDASLLAARVHMAGGEFEPADRAIDALIERSPEDAEVWLYRGRLAFIMGDAKAAQEAFAKSIEIGATRLDFPDLVTVNAGLVESQMALGNTAGAESAYRDLQALAPGAFVTRYLGARLAMQRDDARSAVAELQHALNVQPENSPARLLLASALMQQGSIEQAQTELTSLLARQPDNLQARRLLARIFLERGDAASARRLVAEMPQGEGDALSDWFAGSVLALTGRPEEGLRRLEDAVAADPGNAGLQLDLAAANLGLGRREQAQKILAAVPAGQGGARRRQLEVLAAVIGLEPAAARRGIDRLVQENPQDADLLMLAGQFLLRSGDASGAAALLERALAAAPGLHGALLSLAEASYAGGDIAKTESLLRRAMESTPRDERAYVAMARLLALRGDRAAGRQLLERAIGAEPSALEARLLLADFALADGDTERMRSLAGQALSVTQRRAGIVDRVGQLYMRASLYDEALTHFNEAAAKGHEDAAVNAALALRSLGRPDEARARLEAAAGRRKDWMVPVAHIVALELAQRRFDAALARVQDFRRGGGDPAVVEEMQGDVQRAAGKPAEAIAAYERAWKARPSDSVAVKLFRVRRTEGAIGADASLRQWLEQHPDDVTVRAMLAEHAVATGNRREAIAQYQLTLAAAPSPAVLNNLAWLYYETGDGRAEEFARRAHEGAPANPAIADTYGWVLVEKGKVKEGLPILARAAQGAPENREIQFHYASALVRAGRGKEAGELLRAILKPGADFASKKRAEDLLREEKAP
jgi:putative PEP-CTERM system TPR-repeat lipoprotein